MKKEKIDAKKAVTTELSEFKKFISRGNVVDMAVGVIVGGAFGKIVTSLVNDILMPIIGVLLGGLDFTALTIRINDAVIHYGSFIQSIVDFLIVAFCIFIMVRLFERFKHEEKKEPALCSYAAGIDTSDDSSFCMRLCGRRRYAIFDDTAHRNKHVE